MPWRFKLNAVAVSVVAVCFCWFFEIVKHNPPLSGANAFAEDPFDAIGSFGVQAAALLAGLSLLRALWRYPTGKASEGQKAILTRTQMMAVLAVGLTLAGDVVAMVRYPSLWTGSAGGHLLAGLLGCIILLTVIAGSFVCRSAAQIALPIGANSGSSAVIVFLAFLLILALYPQNWRHGTAGALLTVMVGAALLFVPMRVLGTSLVPYRVGIDPHDPAALAWSSLRRYQWAFLILVGVLAGGFLAWCELGGARGGPYFAGRVAFVGSVYVGLETAVLLPGYGLLREPLGISTKKSIAFENH